MAWVQGKTERGRQASTSHLRLPDEYFRDTARTIKKDRFAQSLMHWYYPILHIPTNMSAAFCDGNLIVFIGAKHSNKLVIM